MSVTTTQLCSTLPLEAKSSHRWYLNGWVWRVPVKLFTEAGGCPDLACRPWFADHCLPLLMHLPHHSSDPAVPLLKWPHRTQFNPLNVTYRVIHGLPHPSFWPFLMLFLLVRVNPEFSPCQLLFHAVSHSRVFHMPDPVCSESLHSAFLVCLLFSHSSRLPSGFTLARKPFPPASSPGWGRPSCQHPLHIFLCDPQWPWTVLVYLVNGT